MCLFLVVADDCICGEQVGSGVAVGWSGLLGVLECELQVFVLGSPLLGEVMPKIRHNFS